MSRDKIRIGYIGTGQVGQFLDGGPYNGVAWKHAAAAKQFSDVEIIAGVSRKKENVETFCREFNVPYSFTDYRELLSLSGLDLVVICTPSGTHADIIIEAADAGKHIIVEKPIDVDLNKIDDALTACRKNCVVLQVGYGRRFLSGMGQLKKAIDENRLGKIVLVHATCQRERPEDYFTKSSWRGTYAGDGGGVLMNQGSHIIDLMLYLCGDVDTLTAVTGKLRHKMIEVEDTAVALLRFKNNALGAVTATTATSPDMGGSLNINGTRATVVLGNPADCWKGPDPPAGLDETLPYDVYAHILRNTVDAIRKGAPLICPGEEGRRSVELILSCYESQKSEREVKLPLT